MNFSTTYIATNFLLGSIMTCPQLSIAMKNGSYSGPSWNIFIGYLFLEVSILCLLSTNMSRLQKVDFVSFYFLSHFYFIFDLFFILSIFKTLGLGLEVISHISHI